MRGPFHRARMGVSNNEELPVGELLICCVAVCARSLLAGVHELDAIALVLEGRAVCALELRPAALLAAVLVVLLADLLTEVDVAHGPEPRVIRDDERGRADVP